MNDKSKLFASTIQRTDNYDDLTIKVKSREEIECLKQEVAKMEYAVNKYNLILGEYQMKYGNELFAQIENNINVESILSKNDMALHKKRLIENIALIKEYEKVLQDKNNSLDFLNEELTSIQSELQKKILENEEIRTELELAKEENAKMYKAILDRKPQQVVNQSDPKEYEQLPQLNDVNSNMNKTEKEQLMSVIENTKYQNEVNDNLINDLREQNNNLIQEHSANLDLINRLKADNENFLSGYDRIQKQLKDNAILLLQYEKDKNAHRAKADKLDLENTTYKKENMTYKDLYEEMEMRKKSEVTALINESLSLRTTIDELAAKTKQSSEELSSIKFENSQLLQENKTVKFDNDHLTKIIEDFNSAVENATEKEKHIDNTIKTYKKRIDDITLEKETMETKLRLKENQLAKVSNNYKESLKEKISNYECLLASSKDDYEKQMMNKNDELNHLRTELMCMKIERDKYMCDYRLLKDENDKFNSMFHEENNKYISKYEESERKSTAMITNYQEKFNMLNIKSDKLESDNNVYFAQLQSSLANSKAKENALVKLTKSEESLMNQLSKSKEQLAFYMKENETMRQDIGKIKAISDLKIQHLKEETDSRMITLENTVSFQKNQIELIEDKALEMLKKQEGLTDKFKIEYYNTIDYYDNILAEIEKNNKIRLSPNKGNEDEMQMPESSNYNRLDRID